MKKVLLTLFTLIFMAQCVNAQQEIFNKAKKITGIPKGAVSVSVRDTATDKVMMELNPDIQVSPASTQKVLTCLAAQKILGKDYNFSTKLYKNKNGDYYLVLGADPYITANDLKELISHINIPKNSELKNFYIDDTVLDNNNWGEGWQWDDGLNTLMPKFGSYNIDKNLYTVIVQPTQIDSPANIFTNIFYPTIFINKTKTVLNSSLIKITQEDNDISPDALTVTGDVAKTIKVNVPVNNLRKYYVLRLDDAFKSNKIYYNGKYERAKLPANSELIAQINHPLKIAINDILKKSSNLSAETVFKLAGGKYANSTGTHANAMAMFNNYCSSIKINCSKIHLTDGSGVSKNNLVTADFMTQYLTKTLSIYDYKQIKELLPTSGEGTLTNRMPMLKDKIHAKTGTLANISGITGYIDTQKGKTYAFAIYINDGNSSDSSKKLYEEIVLRNIYNNF